MTATKNANWFQVDKEGLAAVLGGRPKGTIVTELVQNAWDEDSKVVTVELTIPEGTRGKARLVVTDDNPDGFKDLTHAYTLFAASAKKDDATKRGRFNLGEKLVLAICDEATVVSTTGAVEFTAKGGRRDIDVRRDFGSAISATIRLTKAEVTDALASLRALIQPAGVETIINGEPLPHRTPSHTFHATLKTEISDDEGILRERERKTEVRLYEPLEGETPSIYEIGIPVVEYDGHYHVDIQQKVPLSLDRNNVKPAYKKAIHRLVLDHTFDTLDSDTASSAWVAEALPTASDEAVRKVFSERFGDKAVAFDPSNPEANKRAVEQGFSVVHGRSLPKDVWTRVKDLNLAPAAGKAIQTRPEWGDGEGESERDAAVPEDKITDGCRAVEDYAKRLSLALIGYEVTVRFVSVRPGEHNHQYAAWFGGRTLTFNVGRLGWAWFNSPSQCAVDDLLIHEFAHDRAKDHYTDEFHSECTRLGAKLADRLRGAALRGDIDSLTLSTLVPC